jgi:hypothetical protein
LVAIVLVAPGLVHSQAPNTETEEAQNLIDVAEVTFWKCNGLKDEPSSGSTFYEKEECDHNVLFLKGICESTNCI